jgi:Na+-driven multidrug efflux pump
VSVLVVCGGFYAGYSFKGFWSGFIGGVIGRGIFVVAMSALQAWLNRRSEEQECCQ